MPLRWWREIVFRLWCFMLFVNVGIFIRVHWCNSVYYLVGFTGKNASFLLSSYHLRCFRYKMNNGLATITIFNSYNSQLPFAAEPQAEFEYKTVQFSNKFEISNVLQSLSLQLQPPKKWHNLSWNYWHKSIRTIQYFNDSHFLV
jgi:hypothetical protein